MLDDVDEGLTVNADAVQATCSTDWPNLIPIGFSQVAVNNADGDDLTIMQFNATRRSGPHRGAGRRH